MKRLASVLVILALLLSLTACSKAAGGTYTLTKVTWDGVGAQPSMAGVNITFTLESNGVGTARYGNDSYEITWADNGATVTLELRGKTLELTKDGKNLILHDEGAILYFTPPKETEKDD